MPDSISPWLSDRRVWQQLARDVCDCEQSLRVKLTRAEVLLDIWADEGYTDDEI